MPPTCAPLRRTGHGGSHSQLKNDVSGTIQELEGLRPQGARARGAYSGTLTKTLAYLRTRSSVSADGYAASPSASLGALSRPPAGAPCWKPPRPVSGSMTCDRSLWSFSSLSSCAQHVRYQGGGRRRYLDHSRYGRRRPFRQRLPTRRLRAQLRKVLRRSWPARHRGQTRWGYLLRLQVQTEEEAAAGLLMRARVLLSAQRGGEARGALSLERRADLPHARRCYTPVR